MKNFNVGVEISNEIADGIDVKGLFDELQEEVSNYTEFENGKLYDDLMNSKVRVQLSDANGKIFVGNVDMVVGYCGENLVIAGELLDIIK